MKRLRKSPQQLAPPAQHLDNPRLDRAFGGELTGDEPPDARPSDEGEVGDAVAATHVERLAVHPDQQLGDTEPCRMWDTHLSAQLDDLRANGNSVATIFPDSDAEYLFGPNAMDLTLRAPAARAGHTQGRAFAERLTDFWC